MASINKTKKNRAWIWIFLFLFIASVGVAAFLIRYNLSLLLKPEQLEAARALWREKGPRDYRLVYTKQLGDDPRKDRFVVEVRSGQVRSVIMNQTVFLEPEQMPYHSMDRLLADIARSLEQDEKSGRKVYTKALFDKHTGALIEYVRRVMGGRERVQLRVLEFERLPPLAG
jgi:hypothetical protein